MAGGGTWTAPKTWTAVTLSTSDMNTHVRDNENALTDATSTITTTGTSTALALPTGRGNLVIFANNASTLTIQGITAPSFDGQQLIIYSIGAGNVLLENQNASASAANRIINGVTTQLALVAGSGRVLLRYDTTTARWRVMVHEQGAWSSYTPTWTGTGSNPAIGNGTLAGLFRLSGRTVHFTVYVLMGSTTTFGTGNWSWALPVTSTASNEGFTFAVFYNDTGTGEAAAIARLASTTTVRAFGLADGGGGFTSTSPITWANGDSIRISGAYEAA
jgi:hypothetical protein